MNKRRIVVSVAVTAALALVIAVEPIRAFALDAMSVFRVQGQDSFQITVEDLAELAQNAQSTLSDVMDTEGENWPDGMEHPDLSELPDKADLLPDGRASLLEEGMLDNLKSVAHPLDRLIDFTGYAVSLPKGWDNALLYATDAQETTLTISLEEVNAMLEASGSVARLSNDWDGATLNINMPAMLLAVQDEAALFVCRPPEMTVSGGLDLTELREVLSTVPLLPYNLAQQIRDMKSDVIYLPELVGFTQPVEIGGKMAFVYPLDDLGSYMGTLSASLMPSDGMSLDATEDFSTEAPSFSNPFDEIKGTIVAFVRSDTIYVLAGTASTAEMVQLARTI